MCQGGCEAANDLLSNGLHLGRDLGDHSVDECLGVSVDGVTLLAHSITHACLLDGGLLSGEAIHQGLSLGLEGRGLRLQLHGIVDGEVRGALDSGCATRDCVGERAGGGLEAADVT